MAQRIPLLIGLIIIAGTAWVQGVWSQRWHRSAALEEAIERLHGAPENLGNWKAEPAALEDDTLAAAGAEGAWVRRYTDARSGASVLVILLCGRSGKMSVHRPEDCYRGAGYEMMAEPLHYQIGVDPPLESWTTRFRKEESTGHIQLRIFWTWFGDGLWQAPTSPRLRFAHLPALYKLYAIRELPVRQEKLEQDPSLELLRLLLPALAQKLAPSAE